MIARDALLVFAFTALSPACLLDFDAPPECGGEPTEYLILYEYDYVDLDSGDVLHDEYFSFSPPSDDSWDVTFLYGSATRDHAVLGVNFEGAWMRVDRPFAEVCGTSDGELSSQEFADVPIGVERTFIVKTQTGAFFKVGDATDVPDPSELKLRFLAAPMPAF